MSDPTPALIPPELFGKAITGFFGALASLAMLRDLTPWQAVSTLIVGTLAAMYVAPAVSQWLNVTTPAYDRGVTFLVGFTGFLLLGGIFKLARQFERSPTKTIEQIKRVKG